MRQVNLDCEGPLVKNDIAYELCESFLPEGDKFFSLISKYDDFLSDVVKRKNYESGSTLKFILPFLRIYGVDNKTIKEYSFSHLLPLPGAKETLSKINKMMPTFIISTSYSPFIEAFCDFMNFPRGNTYSTFLNLDKYRISKEEVNELKAIMREILDFSSLEIEEDIQRLDEIFQKKIPFMECGKILKEVVPLGGKEKSRALFDSLKKTGGKLSEVLYAGDSITDVEVLKLVKKGGGIAISFNGNSYALEAAEIACISYGTSPLISVAEAFFRGGRKKVLSLVSDCSEGEKGEKKKYILRLIDKDNIGTLCRESEEVRKKVRGEKLGKLG